MKIDVMTKDKNIKTVVPALRFPEFRDGEGWKRTPILEICEIIGGGTPSSSNDVYWNGDIPWISSSDINENNISEITPTRHITKDAIKHSATKLCKAPSIHIVSRVGVGKVAFSRVDICTSQDFTNLVNKYAEYQARKTSGTRTGHTTKTLHKTRRVFITGGAEGIGKAIVRAFRGAGHRVAFCDKNETLGKETALQTGTQFHLVDVSDKTALEDCLRKIIEEWGDIDIIINNAGVSQFSPITETSVEDFDKILSINLRPAFITSRQLALHRQSLDAQNPYGRIINICSTRYLMSEPGSEGYAASKGGIYSLTHALALSLSEWHITVNSIAPGWIQNNNYDQLRPEDHAQHPSGRVGKPEDIARMCLFLCQEENDFINGENITIDGGMTKKMIYLD